MSYLTKRHQPRKRTRKRTRQRGGGKHDSRVHALQTAICKCAIIACTRATKQKITGSNPTEIINKVNDAYNKAGLCAVKMDVNAIELDYLAVLDKYISDITADDHTLLGQVIGSAMKMMHELMGVGLLDEPLPQISDILFDLEKLYPNFAEIDRQDELADEYRDYIMTADDSILTSAERKRRGELDLGDIKLYGKVPPHILNRRKEGGDPGLITYIQEEKAAGRLTAIPESSST